MAVSLWFLVARIQCSLLILLVVLVDISILILTDDLPGAKMKESILNNNSGRGYV